MNFVVGQWVFEKFDVKVYCEWKFLVDDFVVLFLSFIFFFSVCLVIVGNCIYFFLYLRLEIGRVIVKYIFVLGCCSDLCEKFNGCKQ